LKSISALALEPIEFIENILEKLEVSFGDNWVKFFAYFKNTWLKVYTPKLWNINYLSNHMNNEFITRTNNYLERYNRKLNENLATHGNIVPMLEFFKKEHMFYRSLIASARDGDSEKYPIEIPVTEDPILTELLNSLIAKVICTDKTLKSTNRPMKRSLTVDPKKNKKRKRRKTPKKNLRKEIGIDIDLDDKYWSEFINENGDTIWVEGKITKVRRRSI